MVNYRLLNPYIKGTFKTTFSGDTPVDAAQNTWNELSTLFTNNVPRFGFTLENVKDNSVHNFVVKESVEDNMVDYKIKQLNSKVSKKQLEQIKKCHTNIDNMKGGSSKKKSKDDDSDSDEELEKLWETIKAQKKRNNGIAYYWWYNPLIYNFDSFYLPTFVTPVSPYVEIVTHDTIFV